MLLQLIDWLRHVRLHRKLTPAHALGRRGEDLAHRYLQRQGYRVVSRNFVPRSGHGDLDLVVWHGDRLGIATPYPAPGVSRGVTPKVRNG